MYDVEVALMERLPLFKSVNKSALRELCTLAPPVRFGEGAPIFRQGDASDVAMLLLSGSLRVSIGRGAQVRTVGSVDPGEVVGERALVETGVERSASVIASRDCVALLLTPQVMDHARINAAVVAVEKHLLATLSERIRRTNQNLQQLLAEVGAAVEEPTPSAAPAPTLRARLARLFGRDS